MTIRRGETWGVPAPPPAGMVVLRDGIAVHEWVLDHRRKGIAVPPFGLAGGDLARTVAGGSADQFSVGATLISLDLVRVTAGEMVTWSTAHVVARRSWWTGEVVLVMTAQFLGTADVTPRGHPNDGKADVLRVDPAMRRR
ncbi:MAG: hypothetical protein ABIQ39_03545, partial [Ilumatobacteraceae bacterium]